jgi:hypothetical protein
VWRVGPDRDRLVQRVDPAATAAMVEASSPMDTASPAYFPGGQVSDNASALAVTSLAAPGVSMAAVFALAPDELMVVFRRENV